MRHSSADSGRNEGKNKKCARGLLPKGRTKPYMRERYRRIAQKAIPNRKPPTRFELAQRFAWGQELRLLSTVEDLRNLLRERKGRK